MKNTCSTNWKHHPFDWKHHPFGKQGFNTETT
ncbi:hypothetical protein Asd1617_01212 [Shigella dysenteriae 1617]|uniref:Uncharacterized protein n=1 Tax=Shigella dysenteriae 1617 TaxID=754093 RepID=A0A0A6ZQ23_SHIDY|nr:hypothetical protein Asd1617_01212 [Shigella dysenteriae 1617]